MTAAQTGPCSMRSKTLCSRPWVVAEHILQLISLLGAPPLGLISIVWKDGQAGWDNASGGPRSRASCTHISHARCPSRGQTRSLTCIMSLKVRHMALLPAALAGASSGSCARPAPSCGGPPVGPPAGPSLACCGCCCCAPPSPRGRKRLVESCSAFAAAASGGGAVKNGRWEVAQALRREQDNCIGGSSSPS